MRKHLFLIVAILLSVNMKAIEVENVYIVGDAMPCGWWNSNPERMVETEEGVFVWSGIVKNGGFKFLLEVGHWTNCLNALMEDEVVSLGDDHGLIHIPNYNDEGSAGDYKFILEEAAGGVTITVNTNEMVMTVERKEDTAILTDLWIIGSAIPNGVSKLADDFFEGYFRYNGEFFNGEFKIINTPTIEEGTKFYVPVLEGANVSDISQMQLTENAELPGWKVLVADPYYRVRINPISEIVWSEMCNVGVEELFIVGGATEVGWDSGNAISLERDADNPNLFVFEGILEIATEHDDRNMFKFLCQRDWGPRSYHPMTPGESLLNSKFAIQGYDGDHKWAIDEDKQGWYRIVVDLLAETITAEYLEEEEKVSIANIERSNQYTITSENGSIYVYSNEELNFNSARLLDISAKVIASTTPLGTNFSIGNNLTPGIYLLVLNFNDETAVTKVLIK